jgi:hypothetical protein
MHRRVASAFLKKSHLVSYLCLFTFVFDALLPLGPVTVVFFTVVVFPLGPVTAVFVRVTL